MTDANSELQLIQQTQTQTKNLSERVLQNITACQQLVEQLENNSVFNEEKINSFCLQTKQALSDDLLECFREMQEEINQWGRMLEKKFKPDATQTLFSNECTSQYTLPVNYAIAEYLFRKGNYDIGNCFCKEVGLIEEANELSSKFSNLKSILEQLGKTDTSNALKWCLSNTPTAWNAQFLLHKLNFAQCYKQCTEAHITKSEQKERIVGLVHFSQKSFSPFMSMVEFQQPIQKLMSSLLWLRGAKKYENKKSPYEKMVDLDTVQDEVICAFTNIYCQFNGMPEFSPLEVAVSAGSVAIPKLAKVVALIRERKVEWSQKLELPIEIDLPASFQNYHSIFTCPVLKIQSSAENLPMCLPCGHVICKEALMRLSKGQPNLKFKCPYCPLESQAIDAIVVHL